MSSSEADGDWWYVDGKKTMSFLGIQTGDRFVKSDPDELRTSAFFDDVRPAAYDPVAYLAENETDGVWGSVIYPSQGLVLFSVPVTDVVTATDARVQRLDRRLLQRAHRAAQGHRDGERRRPERGGRRAHALSRARPVPARWSRSRRRSGSPFSSPDYDRFWATAQDLDMPLSMHTATDRGDPRVGDAAFALDVKHVPPSVFINKDYQVRQALGDLIFTGVFERYPGLRVGAVEHELGWIPYFLDQMDYTYTDRPPRGEWHRFPSGVLPSDYWRSQLLRVVPGRRRRHPRARRHRRRHAHVGQRLPAHRVHVPALAGDPLRHPRRRRRPPTRGKIVSTNAANLYHFDPPPAREDAR